MRKSNVQPGQKRGGYAHPCAPAINEPAPRAQAAASEESSWHKRRDKDVFFCVEGPGQWTGVVETAGWSSRPTCGLQDRFIF